MLFLERLANIESRTHSCGLLSLVYLGEILIFLFTKGRLEFEAFLGECINSNGVLRNVDVTARHKVGSVV